MQKKERMHGFGNTNCLFELMHFLAVGRLAKVEVLRVFMPRLITTFLKQKSICTNLGFSVNRLLKFEQA